MIDVYTELRTAVLDYDDWPTPVKRVQVVDAARRFVGAVDQAAAAIEYMRQHVTPSEQALNELLGG